MTLKDGYEVEKKFFEKTCINILYLRQSKTIGVLLELVEKCIDPTKEYSLSPDAKTVLRKYDLLDENECVPKPVKKIVLNAIRIKNNSLTFHNPLREACKL